MGERPKNNGNVIELFQQFDRVTTKNQPVTSVPGLVVVKVSRKKKKK